MKVEDCLYMVSYCFWCRRQYLISVDMDDEDGRCLLDVIWWVFALDVIIQPFLFHSCCSKVFSQRFLLIFTNINQILFHSCLVYKLGMSPMCPLVAFPSEIWLNATWLFLKLFGGENRTRSFWIVSIVTAGWNSCTKK